MNELFYQLALTQIDNVGNKLARLLLAKFGSAEAVFKASPKDLQKIEHFGPERIKAFKNSVDLKRVESELAFIEKHKINTFFINEANYPYRLKECADAPYALFYKGTEHLFEKKSIAIVGTRNNTDYGRQIAEELLDGFKGREDIVVISGLASGVDTIAHKSALRNALPTIGVLGHGLDRIYPQENRKLAEKMLHNGGLLTEYLSGTQPDKQNFPQRNRIVAGLSDVTIVVETGVKGGSMITAKLACSYNREVAAFPGRSIDKYSSGCNYLIKTNIAHAIENAQDLMDLMNWQPQTEKQSATIQKKLFETLNEEERKIMELLKDGKEIHIDELCIKTGHSNTQISALLLSLEMEGLLRSLPGKRYRIS